MKDSRNPWLGLKSYEENDRLYGRDKEASELSNIILNSFHAIIYGKSGIGKTSLLKAGVFPVLRYEDFYPIYIRLEHDTAQNTSYEYYISQIENLLKQEYPGIDIQKEETEEITFLSDLFNSYHFSTSKGIELTPVFVFDQFEEIFTLNEDNDARVSRFFKDISDILNGDISEKSYRLVFSLREDYLYCIERYSETIPAFKRNRYSLKDLSREEAFEVITIPRKGLVDNVVAQEILHKLTTVTSDEISATILSLYLSQLYDRMTALNANSISLEIMHLFGDDIISSFYDDNIKGISDKSLAFLEDHLVTVGGYRHNIPLEDALSAGVTQKEINNLKEKRIVNVQPSHFNIPFIEFSHDVLCPVVIKHKNERVVKENARKIRKHFIELASIIIIVAGIFTMAKIIKLNTTLKAQLEEIESKNIAIEKQNNQITELYAHAVQRASVSGAMKICEDIRAAVDVDDMQRLRDINQELELIRTGINFTSFRTMDENGDWPNGLNGHFVFEPLFIEEYIQNKNVIKDAQYYASRSSTLRGKTGADMVFIKTCIIRKESTATWTYVVNGHNELAIVAEPKGLLTMNVFDVKNNRRYDSTVQVERGTSSRYVVFDTLGNAKIEVTIINTTKQDVSFVVISN